MRTSAFIEHPDIAKDPQPSPAKVATASMDTVAESSTANSEAIRPSRVELTTLKKSVKSIQQAFITEIGEAVLDKNLHAILNSDLTYKRFPGLSKYLDRCHSTLENLIENSLLEDAPEDAVVLCSKLLSDLDILRELMDRVALGTCINTGRNLHNDESHSMIVRSCRLLATSIAESLSSVKSCFISETTEQENEPELAEESDWWGQAASESNLEDIIEAIEEEEYDELGEEELEDAGGVGQDRCFTEATTELKKGEHYADMHTESPGAGLDLGVGRIIHDGINFCSFLSVFEASVVTGADGRIQDLFHYLEQEVPDTDLYSDLIVETNIPATIDDNKYRGKHAIIEPKFKQVTDTLRVELSPAFEVTELVLFNEFDQAIKLDNLDIKSCRLGGFEIKLPEDIKASQVRRIRCIIKPSNWNPSSDHVEQLDNLLPRLDSFGTRVYASVVKALNKSNEPLIKKAQILYSFIIDRKFYGCSEQKIASLVNTSGNARNEVISALRIGNCMPFAYHLAFEFRKIGIPAFIITGSTPRKKQKDFKASSMHAQVAILVEGAWCVFDLTHNTAHDKHVKTHLLFDAELKEVIDKMKESTRREVFIDMKAIRERVLQKPKSDNDHTSVRVSFSRNSSKLSPAERANWSFGSQGYYSSPSASYEFSENERNAIKSQYSNDPSIRARQVGMHLRAYYGGLNNAITTSKNSNSLEPVLQYLREEEDPPKASPRDRTLLGRRYVKLCGLSPKNVVNASARKFLRLDSQHKNLKTESAEWLTEFVVSGTKLSIHQGSDALFTENYKGYSMMDPEYQELLINAPNDVVIASVGEKRLGEISQSSLQNFTKSVAQHNRDTFPAVFEHSSRRSTIDLNERVINDIQVLKKCVDELGKRENKDDFETAIELIAMLGANIAAVRVGQVYSNISTVKNLEEMRLELLDTLIDCLNKVVIATAEQTPTATLWFKGLHELDDAWRRGLAYFCQDEELSAKVPWLRNKKARRKLEKELSNLLATAITENLRPGFDFERTIRRLKDAGFKVDLSPHRQQIIKAVPKLLEIGLPEQRYQGINFPTLENPGSHIVAYLSDLPEAHLARSIDAIEACGVSGIAKEAQKHWQPVSEEAVVEDLARQLSTRLHTVGDTTVTFNNKNHDKDFVELGELVPFLREAFTERKKSLHVLDLVEKCGLISHPLDQGFYSLKERFPRQWSKLCDKVFQVGSDSDSPFAGREEQERRDYCAFKLANILFRETDPKVTYKLFLGLHEIVMRPYIATGYWNLSAKERKVIDRKGDQAIRSLWKRIAKDSNPKFAQDYWLNSWMQQNLPLEFKSNEFFGPQDPRSQLNSILVLVLSRNFSSRRMDDLSGSIGLPYDTLHTYDCKSHQFEKLSKRASVWKFCFSGVTTGYETWGVLKRIREEAHALSKRISNSRNRIPYAKFLTGTCARLKAPSNSGEFESYRSYTIGDDMRHLDQKAYARTDKRLVRKYEDQELAPISFIVDAEWLVDGYSEYRNHDRNDRHKLTLYPNLKTLYLHLFMAKESNLKSELLIVARGHIIKRLPEKELKKVLEPHTLPKKDYESYYGPKTTDEEFLRELLDMGTSHGSKLKPEYELFGSDGLRAFSVMEGFNQKISTGTEIIAFIHPRNLNVSASDLSSFGRRMHCPVYIHKNTPKQKAIKMDDE